MTKKVELVSRTVAVLIGLMGGTNSANAEFVDPLDAPSLTISAPAAAPTMALADLHGGQFVGVGMRGLIVTSSDGGRSWVQAAAPVQSDLTAVQFPTDKEGWAVGHDGVILHSGDSGLHWDKQFDGRQAASQFSDYYRQRIAGGDVSQQIYLDQITLNFKNGPSLPYLDVWFETPMVGYAVGSFGMIAATADGGKTWVPWLDHIDNPDFLNLNGVRGVGSEIYIVGERGTIYRLDRTQQKFKLFTTGYAGSFFGIVGNSDALIAFGLRGTLYRSTDAGDHWAAVSNPEDVTITAATLTGSGDILLGNMSGRVVSSSDKGQTFRVRPLDGGGKGPLTGILEASSQGVVVSGLGGVQLYSSR